MKLPDGCPPSISIRAHPPRRVRTFTAIVSPGIQPQPIPARFLSRGLALKFENGVAYLQAGALCFAARRDGHDRHGPIKVARSHKARIRDACFVASTRRPTERKKSFQGISSVPETYFVKNHPRSAWLTASAASRTPSESSKKRPFFA